MFGFHYLRSVTGNVGLFMVGLMRLHCITTTTSITTTTTITTTAAADAANATPISLLPLLLSLLIILPK